MRRQVIGGLLVAGLSAGLLGACGDDDDAGEATGEGSTTTEGTLAPPFQDGTYFGYIVHVDLEEPGGPYADFDVARLLEGDEALQAQADGVAGCEEVVDFCIDNADDTVRLVPIADDVEVLDIDFDECCDARPGDLETFAADRNPPRTPVNITVESAEITKIEEVYFP